MCRAIYVFVRRAECRRGAGVGRGGVGGPGVGVVVGGGGGGSSEVSVPLCGGVRRCVN